MVSLCFPIHEGFLCDFCSVSRFEGVYDDKSMFLYDKLAYSHDINNIFNDKWAFSHDVEFLWNRVSNS